MTANPSIEGSMSDEAGVGDCRLPRLRALIDAIPSILPGLPVALGEPLPGSILPGRDNSDALARLAASLRAAEPDAGPGFWSLRSWAMITWQPVALGILSVHGFGFLPAVERIGQSVEGAAVWGFQLPGSEPQLGPEDQLISEGGRRIEHVSGVLFHELNREIRVKPELARRILADRIVGILLRLSEQGLLDKERNVPGLAARWLAATGLAGKSGVMTVSVDGGGLRYALDRKACCLEFRARSGTLCQTCPKQEREERMERLREFWSSNVPIV